MRNIRFDHAIMLINVICANKKFECYLISIGLTPAYDILPHNGIQSYFLKGIIINEYPMRGPSFAFNLTFINNMEETWYDCTKVT